MRKKEKKWERKEGCKKVKEEAENNEKKREKGGVNSSKEGCKKVKEEAENNGKRGQPTKGKVGCKKVRNEAAN